MVWFWINCYIFCFFIVFVMVDMKLINKLLCDVFVIFICNCLLVLGMYILESVFFFIFLIVCFSF